MFLNYSKKLLMFAVTTLSVFSISNLKAQSSEFYLQQIMNNTKAIQTSNDTIRTTTNTIQTNTASILQKVDALPLVLEKLGSFIEAWLDEDDSDTTANMVPVFKDWNDLVVQNLTEQLNMQATINKALLTDNGVTRENLPSGNDLLYSTLLGSFYFKDDKGKDPRGGSVNPQLNYILNASGITIPHIMPTSGWGGRPEDRLRYRSYYNSVMAAQSFNGYVLSNQYLGGNKFNEKQEALITQASDPDKWFAEVASEKIGFVLRQLLIYQSQIFLMLTQLVQLQKQMVTGQAITNTLLISSGMSNEALLLAKAQGVRPAA